MGFFSNLFNRGGFHRGGGSTGGRPNTAMGPVEDETFESSVRQTILDMKAELNRTVRASAEAMSNTNRLEAEHGKHRRQADEWRARARQAQEASNEDLAKLALSKKIACDRQIGLMQQSVEAARRTSERLKTQVAGLRAKIAEAERNASTLIARKNAARAQKKVAEALAGLGEADNAFAALRDFEDRVTKEEARAAAFEEMTSTGRGDGFEDEFAALDPSNVDDELAKLRAEMGS